MFSQNRSGGNSARRSFSRGNSGGSPRRFGGGGGRPQFRKSNATRFSKYIDPRLFVCPARPVTIEEAKIDHAFSDFNLSDMVKENLSRAGFVTPTPIQDKALETALDNRDVLGLADTGTGKTLTFILPIIEKLLLDREQTALIVAPTRELAVQIRDEIRKVSQGIPVYPCILIGGSDIRRQMDELRRRPNIFVGTPGRLKDLYNRRALRLDRVKTVVLDEVDRMLDMGFINDINELLSYVPTNRQTLLFSATMDAKIEKIACDFMSSPAKISVKTGATAQNVEQNIVRASGKESKIRVLRDLLSQEQFVKTLIFGRTKHGVEELSEELIKLGYKAGSIHGNKRQNQREMTLRYFKENRINVLVATDVAARGIDVKDISHVINFDQPATYEDYVHRIGRTGRAGKSGSAITFVD